MGTIGTGCNSSWYLWPEPMARFLVVTAYAPTPSTSTSASSSYPYYSASASPEETHLASELLAEACERHAPAHPLAA